MKISRSDDTASSEIGLSTIIISSHNNNNNNNDDDDDDDDGKNDLPLRLRAMIGLIPPC